MVQKARKKRQQAHLDKIYRNNLSKNKWNK